ncbi:hypothetical protein RchiOBHm_Chr5g0066341 [Rosa chinensis]|uniref:Uncharacterized protein n=1 Tax=Rosa chinensis TaxID=74649 RepID=A0A2P6QJ52_ROSCH|nr:hypothetical protein RchiOBHm_Chr5g0066341 [Rosa chinensis]
MEVHNACNIKAKEGRLSSRLQERAPASLHLDQITSTAPANPFSDTPNAIPLLSPVVIRSPESMAEKMEKDCDQGMSRRRNITATESPFQSGAGWQHPAVSAFADPSSLLTVFQSQCMITNHAE